MDHQIEDIDPEIHAIADKGITFKSFLKTAVSKEKLDKILQADDDDAATACLMETLIGFVFIGESFCLKDVFRHFENPDERIERFKKSEAYSLYVKNYLFDKNDRSTIVGKEVPDFDKLLALAAICRFVLNTYSGALDTLLNRVAYLDESGCTLHSVLEGVYNSIRSGSGIRMVHLADGRMQIDIQVEQSSIPSHDNQVKH